MKTYSVVLVLLLIILFSGCSSVSNTQSNNERGLETYVVQSNELPQGISFDEPTDYMIENNVSNPGYAPVVMLTPQMNRQYGARYYQHYDEYSDFSILILVDEFKDEGNVSRFISEKNATAIPRYILLRDKNILVEMTFEIANTDDKIVDELRNTIIKKNPGLKVVLDKRLEKS